MLRSILCEFVEIKHLKNDGFGHFISRISASGPKSTRKVWLNNPLFDVSSDLGGKKKNGLHFFFCSQSGQKIHSCDEYGKPEEKWIFKQKIDG